MHLIKIFVYINHVWNFFVIFPIFMAGTRGCWTNQTGWILSSGMDTASICVINWTKLIETGLCVYMHQCIELFHPKKETMM